MRSARSVVLAAIATFTLACSAPAAPRTEGQPGAPAPQQQRTLTAAVRVEPTTTAVKSVRGSGVALYLTGRMFNADIGILDDEGAPRPYLVEALPQLNSDSWQVFADGRMQTTYRLKPNLVWHDGTALSADDFVFAWKVYSWTELGPTETPISLMEDVAAPDPRTVVVKWKQPYADAASLTDRSREFPALPRHILEAAFNARQADPFVSHNYWTLDYVGLGPYRLVRWEPGAFLEGAAFDQHILGRPKIDRVKVLFQPDSNTVLANLLAGEVQLSADTSLRVSQVPVVLRQWGEGGGTAVLHPNQYRAVIAQLRPDYANPKSLMDPRVRKALAHSIDKDPINQAAYDGQSIFADSWMPATSAVGRVVDASITKYPFDIRRSEELMGQAGFRKGADGTYAGADGRFSTEIKTNAASDNELEMSSLAAGWRQAGFDVKDGVLPAALAQDNEARATFSGLFSFNTGLGEAAAIGYTTQRMATAANRWQGGNRAGFSNPDYDRLVETFSTSLDRTERTRLLAEMGKTFTENVAAISLFFRTQPWVFPSSLKGPRLVPSEANVAWNIQEWETTR
jgi:peptide/nickel transport system substrate-binding protein